MGKSYSKETIRKMGKRMDTVEGLSKRFEKFGFRYICGEHLDDKPWLCKGKKPIKALGIRQAQTMLKKKESKK